MHSAVDRTILHIDMNNFYASVELLDNPHLADKPIAVGGNEAMRHGIILAKNYIAKRFGVKTAEPIWEAKRKCPRLIVIAPHFDRYLNVSRMSRELLNNYSDRVEPFGIDEAWIDISDYASSADQGKAVADELRARYRDELGVTASVGVSFNKVFAKLGSDLKKPDATTVISKQNFKTTIWQLPVEDLLFIGSRTKEKLSKRGIHTIGQLANSDAKLIHDWLGKNGDMLRAYANGLDSSPVRPAGVEAALKSLGNSTTPPNDIHDEGEAIVILQSLAETVAHRLRANGLRATVVALHVRDNAFASFERQIKLRRPTCVSTELRGFAMQLLRENYDWRRPIRSLGIRTSGLVGEAAPQQLSMFEDNSFLQKLEKIERSVDMIRDKYGKDIIKIGTAAYMHKPGNVSDTSEHPYNFYKYFR